VLSHQNMLFSEGLSRCYPRYETKLTWRNQYYGSYIATFSPITIVIY